MINLANIEPIGIIIPEDHPDFQWRDPEEVEAGIAPEDHPYFGVDAVDFVYETWGDEFDSRWETLTVANEPVFKVGPIKVGEDNPEATCDIVMELLEDVKLFNKDHKWYDQREFRLEQTIQPGEWCSNETLLFNDKIILTTVQTRSEIRRDALNITCSKVFDLMRLVYENIAQEIPMTFIYVYRGVPRTGVFSNSDFAA